MRLLRFLKQKPAVLAGKLGPKLGVLRPAFNFLSTQTGVILLINLLLCLVLGFITPYFFLTANMLALGVAMSSSVLAAIGSTFVLLTGCFDLSIGSSYGMAGIVTSHALLVGIPVLPSCLLGLLSGVAMGVGNGFFVTRLKVNPFITTMGTMTIGRGLINIFTQGYSISGLPDSFMRLIKAKLLGLPPSLLIMIVVTILADTALRRSRRVRQVYYIGGNADYARLVGINVNRVRMMAYIFSGLLAALGGLLFTMRTGAGSQQAGMGLEMIALIAPFLGGVGFGGEGTILAAFLGAALLALITNGIQLLGIPALWQNVITGTFLITAALIGVNRMQRLYELQRRERR